MGECKNTTPIGQSCKGFATDVSRKFGFRIWSIFLGWISSVVPGFLYIPNCFCLQKVCKIKKQYNIDIKTFVETSLIQIVEGVNSANTVLPYQGAYISSKNVRPLRERTTYNTSTGDLVKLIEFDIAVTVNEKDASEGGAGIKVGRN